MAREAGTGRKSRPHVPTARPKPIKRTRQSRDPFRGIRELDKHDRNRRNIFR